MRLVRVTRAVVVAASMLLIPLVSESPAVNVLSNAGFESGALAPWVNDLDFCGGCTWSVTSADAHSGTFSAVVVGNRLLTQAFAGIDTDLITETSLWLRSSASAIAAVRFEYSDGSSEEHIVSFGTAWTQFDLISFLDPGKLLTEFGVFGCSGCSGNTFADDFVVEVRGVPLPATLALLALGAGGLGLTLRKRRR